MTIRTYITVLFCSAAFPVFSQSQMFADAFQEFSKERIRAYEQIPVDWRMDSRLQADFNEGLNNLIEDSPAMAEASFSEVIRKDSSMWQAWYFRSAAWKQLHVLRPAERDIRQALKLHAEFYEGYVELAKILHLQGRYDESERMINRAIRIDKSKPVAYYVKGDINLNQGQSRVATNNYRECVAVDSLFHDARIMLALLELVAKKDAAPALKHLNRVLTYDSLQKTALLFRSILAYDKDREQCVRDLTNLVLVSPSNMMAYYIRGVYYTELGNFRQAFSDFHRVIRTTETSDNNFQGKQTGLDKKIDLQNAGAYTVTRVYGLPEEDALKLQEAYCHILTEAFDKAISVIEKTTNPAAEPLAQYLLAVAHEHKGEHSTALQFYNKALALDDDISDAHKKRAIYAQELKEWKQSIRDFTNVLRLNPESFIVYRMRGVSYFYDNDFSKAIDDYNRYLEHDSVNREVIGYRGMAYLKDKQRLPAYVDLVVSGNGQMLDFRDAEKLIDSLLAKGDTLFAMTCLNKLTDGAPRFTEGWVQKFTIHLQRDDWKPIANDITRALRSSRADAAKSGHSFLLTLAAMNHSRNRHTQDAVKLFDEAIKFDKKNAMAYLERGKLLLAMGKTSKAESDFREALSLGNEKAKEMLASMTR